ncbi:MAG: GNAT family N-acetyltransferase [Candidatus Latescibacter sp.]|nr:GNAT family N-acetyltransferase [Candidatus Latescibacter sp.]
MAGKMEILKVEDASLWDAFALSSPQGTVFSTSGWMQAAARTQGGKPVFLGVFENGKPAAGVSFVELARGPFKKATTPVLTPYGGILYRPFPGMRESEAESFNHSCAEMIIEYLQKRYDQVFLVNSPGFGDVRPFSWNRFACTVQYTYILDIESPDKLWERLERRVRTVIRNAEASLFLEGPVSAEQFGDLYEHTYKDRGNKPPVNRSMVVKMVEAVMSGGMGEMRTVRDGDGKIVAAMIFTEDARRVYAWVSGVIPALNHTGASSLLFWDAARSHSGENTCLDLVGANLRTISFFKKGFGGALTPYYTAERYSSRVTHALFSFYSRLNKVVRVCR